MKALILLLLVSCSSVSNKPKKAIIREAYKLPARSFEEKKVLLQEMVRNHDEYDAETREKLESLLNRSLEKAQELQKRESQLITQIGRNTIVEQADYDDLVALKAEMKNIYQQKYQNFDETITQLKKIIGITPDNSQFLEDMSNMEFFIRN